MSLYLPYITIYITTKFPLVIFLNKYVNYEYISLLQSTNLHKFSAKCNIILQYEISNL